MFLPEKCPQISSSPDGGKKMVQTRHAEALSGLRLSTSVAWRGKLGRTVLDSQCPESQKAVPTGQMVTKSTAEFILMNRFRKLGFVGYNCELEVHSSLLNVVLHD